MCTFANPKEVQKPKALICTRKQNREGFSLMSRNKSNGENGEKSPEGWRYPEQPLLKGPFASLVTIWRLFAIFAKPFASSSPTRTFLNISQDSDRISKMTSSCKWPVGWYSYLNQKNQNKQHNRLNEKIQRHLTDTRSLPVQAMISVFYIWLFASETSPSEKNTRFCY